MRTTTVDRGLKPVLDYDYFNKTVSTFGVGSNEPYSTKGSTITMVENLTRPGADQGYLMNKRDLVAPSFNSTKPRFNYTQQISIEMAKPGPGTYDTPARQSDMY